MIQEVVAAVAEQLKRELVSEEALQVYLDRPEEPAKPYLWVSLKEASCRQVLNKRYCGEILVEAQYFPDTDTSAQICGMGEKLLRILELLSMPEGDILRGTNMNYQVTPENTKLSVCYKLYLYKEGEQEEMMEEIEFDERKGE